MLPLFFFFKSMYLFLAALGLCCCTWVVRRGSATVCWYARASHCSGFSCWGAGALGHMGFSSCGSRAVAAAAAAESLQSCLTLCSPIDGSPPGSSVHRILWAKTLEWVAISFSTWAVEDRLNSCGALAPQHVGSSQTRDHWTCVFCTGRRILYHWATREAPCLCYNFYLF